VRGEPSISSRVSSRSKPASPATRQHPRSSSLAHMHNATRLHQRAGRHGGWPSTLEGRCCWSPDAARTCHCGACHRSGIRFHVIASVGADRYSRNSGADGHGQGVGRVGAPLHRRAKAAEEQVGAGLAAGGWQWSRRGGGSGRAAAQGLWKEDYMDSNPTQVKKRAVATATNAAWR
jgi:hypothetical protein